MYSPNSLIVRSENCRFAENESHVCYRNHIFVRLVAIAKTFTDVDFRFCVFDGCYLRDCKFLNCDFTGTKFSSSSFHGSSFTNCVFNYTTFEKTEITPDILDTQAPEYENLRSKFARSLRMNFQQLGDAESVNKAIKIELQATKIHLHEAWHSRKDYYRDKYPGVKRAGAFFEWFWFRLQHFLWGNGESALRLLTTLLFLFLGMAIYHSFRVGDPARVSSYWEGLRAAPEVYLGVRTFSRYGYWYIAFITATRLLTFAALTSILIKRFNRR